MLRSKILRLALPALVVCLLAAPEVGARERQARARRHAPTSGHAERTVTRTGPDGTSRTSSHESTWQRGEGQWSRETTHTGPQGGVTTRDASGSFDPVSKTWTRDATTTRPDGATTTSHTEGARTEAGYQRTTTHTGPQGTTTVEGQGSWDPATKTWTREKSVTRPDGSTSQVHSSTVVTPVTHAPQSSE